MVDIPIVHGYAALVANATDVVGLGLLCDGNERYSSTYMCSTILTLAGLNCKACDPLGIEIQGKSHLSI